MQHDKNTGDMGDARPILRVKNLVKTYQISRRGLFGGKDENVSAVDDVSFDLNRGEILGIVGESGCGKSTLAKLIVRLIEPSSGLVEFADNDISSLSKRSLRAFRREAQIVFQDPYASLNPRFRVFDIVAESWRIFPDLVPKEERKTRAAELLERVGLDGSDLWRYPSEFSGGQRQRIGIARALSMNPQMIVCDEAVSALDVSIQAQILNLLKKLQHEMGISFVFISHDLSVVRHMADRIIVMYLGKIVEMGRCDAVYSGPAHPYTKALISSVPNRTPGSGSNERIVLEGDIPTAIDPPSGCRFRTRCWKATEVCERQPPPLADVEGTQHRCACHFPEGQTGGAPEA